MNLRRALLLSTLALMCSARAAWAQPAPRVDAPTRQVRIEQVAAAMNEGYGFPDVARQVAAAFKDPARLAALQHADAMAFAKAMTDLLQDQTKDKHLRVVYSPTPVPEARGDRLDAMPKDVAQAGVQVSAHPDTIGRIGTKNVLFDTRDLPFGSDVCRVDSLARLQAELPMRMAHGARVLKQHRGYSDTGVWRVKSAGDGALNVQHAQRGSTRLLMDMATLQATLAPYFEPSAGGHMLDKAWQPRLAEGMVRA